jgi:PhnB protein
MPSKIPEGFHTVTPGLTVRDAAKAIDFYRRAFGAVELFRMEAPGGKIGHAELKIGDSIIMLGDEFPGGARSPQSLDGTSVTLHVTSMYRTSMRRSSRQSARAQTRTCRRPTCSGAIDMAS